MDAPRRVLWGVCALVAIIAIGVTGYITSEGWPFLDSLYMTIITITTVGYNEVHNLTTSGRIFSIFLILWKMIWGIDVEGWASLLLAILVLSGIQLMGLGILGEYVGRSYMNINRKPQFVLKDIRNVIRR